MEQEGPYSAAFNMGAVEKPCGEEVVKKIWRERERESETKKCLICGFHETFGFWNTCYRHCWV